MRVWAAAMDLPEELERVIQLQLRRQEDPAEALEHEQPRADVLGRTLLKAGVADEAHPVRRADPRAWASTKRAVWGRSQGGHAETQRAAGGRTRKCRQRKPRSEGARRWGGPPHAQLWRR